MTPSTLIPHPLDVPGAARRAWILRIALRVAMPIAGLAATITLLRVGFTATTWLLLCATLVALLALRVSGRLARWWAWTEIPGAYASPTRPSRVSRVDRVPGIVGLACLVTLAVETVRVGLAIGAGQIPAGDPRLLAWGLVVASLTLVGGFILRRDHRNTVRAATAAIMISVAAGSTAAADGPAWLLLWLPTLGVAVAAGALLVDTGRLVAGGS